MAEERTQFSIGETVEWAPIGADAQLVTVHAIDERTEPPTYIVALGDGGRRGARHAHLRKVCASALDGLAQQSTAADPTTVAAQSAKTISGAAKRAFAGLKGWMGKKETSSEQPSEAGTADRAADGSFASVPSQQSSTPVEASLDRLVEMGFDRSAAARALQEHGGSRQDAAAALLREQSGGSRSAPAPASAGGDMPGWQRVALGLDAGQATAPVPAPAATPAPAPAPAPAAAVRLRSASAAADGSATAEVEWDAPPAGPGAAAAVSVGLKLASSLKWTHNVGPSGVPQPFAGRRDWRASCHPPAASSCRVSGLRCGVQYCVSVRHATAVGPGPCLPPLTFTVPGADAGPAEDAVLAAAAPAPAPAAAPAPAPAAAPAATTPPPFDAFADFLGSCSPTPPAPLPAAAGSSSPPPKQASPSAPRKWPKHAPGQIYDVD
eukprot:TRINITY_DN3554_c0_g1_i1.p1 TRINITY_DN3554_c0_g1~~TRINITY_DN3554_c0_g1_i1.p1  ORF type:complete len:437 (+),score=121.18 TRINITY_DN3554_c0_g1_i1:122-1432(+)